MSEAHTKTKHTGNWKEAEDKKGESEEKSNFF